MKFYLYCVTSTYTANKGLRKIGCTTHPVARLQVYQTGDPPGVELEKYYEGIWEVTASSQQELKKKEGQIHSYFKDVRQNRSSGRASEWFHVSWEDVNTYVKGQGFFVRSLAIEEIEKIRRLSELSAPHHWIEQEVVEQEQEHDEKKEEQSLFTRFCQVFLPEHTPRRIQQELWDIFEEVCRTREVSDEIYKGIVQWPTGTGKTIAILLLIVLAKHYCSLAGGIYRSILVSPRNDIFKTIGGDFRKLSIFGITLYDGSDGKFSRLAIPTDEDVLIMACPDSLRKQETGMESLPPIHHVHYDEVHRITGSLFFEGLKEHLVVWKTAYLTGTSATPKTSCPEQHRKFSELFGDPYPLLHRCEVDEAVREGWIATPRFHIQVTPRVEKGGETAYYQAMLEAIRRAICRKKEMGLWQGGKLIVYTSTVEATRWCASHANEIIPEAVVYQAVDGVDRSDSAFVDASPDGAIRILFACDRYREGSDIKGLEMTTVLIGDSISAYILIQIQGRSLRLDYSGKEGWCLIVCPCEEGETEDAVFDRVALNLFSYLGTQAGTWTKKDIQRYVTMYFADVVLNGRVCSTEETIKRIQAAYLRREFQEERTPKQRLEAMRAYHRDMGLCSKIEYLERYQEHPHFIPDPRAHFQDRGWISWYHYLGKDTSQYPATKTEWIARCKERGIQTWEQYKEEQKKVEWMPSEPGGMYDDFTSWSDEFGGRLVIRRPRVAS
jgi:superfamily II DNA or RNA helicase